MGLMLNNLDHSFLKELLRRMVGLVVSVVNTAILQLHRTILPVFKRQMQACKSDRS